MALSAVVGSVAVFRVTSKAFYISEISLTLRHTCTIISPEGKKKEVLEAKTNSLGSKFRPHDKKEKELQQNVTLKNILVCGGQLPLMENPEHPLGLVMKALTEEDR